MNRKTRKSDPKLTILARSGVANARANEIEDSAFVRDDFFDPRDLLQVRYEMLRRVRVDGQSIADVAKSFGVSRPTFYKIQDGFDRGGFVGLLPVKRGPQGPHKLTPEVMRFIEEEVACAVHSDPVRITAEIARRFDLVLHKRTVMRALATLKKSTRDVPRH